MHNNNMVIYEPMPPQGSLFSLYNILIYHLACLCQQKLQIFLSQTRIFSESGTTSHLVTPESGNKNERLVLKLHLNDYRQTYELLLHLPVDWSMTIESALGHSYKYRWSVFHW